MNNQSERLRFALTAVQAAGLIARDLFQSRLKVSYKEDDSPVTEADRQVEASLRRAIADRFPGEKVLGEEEGETGHGDSQWVIDPIDGTKSYIAGVPLFATLLSYEEDGVPMLGVCALPALGDVLYAERSKGAFCNDRQCQVSTTTEWSRAMIATAGPSSLTKTGLIERTNTLSTKVLASRTWCDAYGHALVATGRVEAMIDPVLKVWDISAVSLIVHEAGGKCTGLAGESWPRGGAISSNGLIHASLYAELGL